MLFAPKEIQDVPTENTIRKINYKKTTFRKVSPREYFFTRINKFYTTTYLSH